MFQGNVLLEIKFQDYQLCYPACFHFYDELDNLWEEIVADCKQHGTESSLNYGSLFYRILGTKAVEFIKKKCDKEDFDKEDNENKLKFLKGFIENIDKYME